jgi:hypothetical protein
MRRGVRAGPDASASTSANRRLLVIDGVGVARAYASVFVASIPRWGRGMRGLADADRRRT